MKSRLFLAGILAASPAVFGQSAGVSRQEGIFYMHVPAPPSGAGDHTFEFISSEFRFEGNIVKNAPYSAQAVTETTQRLADGNRISNKTTANLFRDSEGRTRREETLGAIGPWASNADPAQTVFINDPVSNTNLVLDSRNKTARKMPSPKIRLMSGGEPVPGVTAAMDAHKAELMVEKIKAERDVSRRTVTVAQGGGAVGDILISGSRFEIPLGAEVKKKNAVEESLGSQMIEGVRADGTRTTMTIPAGAIGNEQPIQIVSERWYSPELQTVVMTKRSDPRLGETVYRLTNISRTEPSHSLFEAPADYTVEEARPLVHERRVTKD